MPAFRLPLPSAVGADRLGDVDTLSAEAVTAVVVVGRVVVVAAVVAGGRVVVVGAVVGATVVGAVGGGASATVSGGLGGGGFGADVGGGAAVVAGISSA